MLKLLNLNIYFQVISPCRHVACNHPGTARLFCLQASDEKHIQQNIFQHSTQQHSVLGMTATGHIKCSGGRMLGTVDEAERPEKYRIRFPASKKFSLRHWLNSALWN
jgi:hypothetical protein